MKAKYVLIALLVMSIVSLLAPVMAAPSNPPASRPTDPAPPTSRPTWTPVPFTPQPTPVATMVVTEVPRP